VDSLSLSCLSHRLEDGRWLGPTDIYRAPVAVKARATPGDAPGLTGVSPDQEGTWDNPGGHHVAALAPPRTPSGAPQQREDQPDHPGASRDKKAHQSVSKATPVLPGVTQSTSDTGGTQKTAMEGTTECLPA